MAEKLIGENDHKELVKEFASFKNDVDVKVIKGPEDNEYTEFTINFLSELSELSDKIKVEVLPSDSEISKKNQINVFPYIFLGYDQGYRIEFMGAPLGYEARSLIEGIKMLASGKSSLSDNGIKKIGELDTEKTIHVFVTPTCPYCPGSVVLAHSLAFVNKKVRGICVEATEAQELSERFNVSSVPQQVVDLKEENITVGAQPEMKFITELLNK